MDGRRFRLHLTAGYRLRTDLTKGELEAVESYRESGDPQQLPLRYVRLREAIRTRHLGSNT